MTPEERVRTEGMGRTDTETLEERVRGLEERLRKLQEERGRSQRPQAVFDRLVPAEARRHLRAAQRERLLAVRAFVDAAIKRTEDQPANDGRPRRPESVRID